MAESNPIPQPAEPLVALSDTERMVVQRLRQTPQERQAEHLSQKQAHLARVPVAVRQASEARAERLASMTPDQRRVYHLSQHLVVVVQRLRQESKRGVALADVLAAPEATEAEAVRWFFDEVKKPKTTPAPVEAGMVDDKGGKP